MDYGRGGIRAMDIPLLGKKACMQVASLSKLQEEECTDCEERESRWGKEKLDDTLAGVDYHPYRKQ